MLVGFGEVPGAAVVAGSTVTVELPSTSSFVELGVDSLADAAFGLQAVDASGAPTDAAPVEVAAVVSADGGSAVLTVP